MSEQWPNGIIVKDIEIATDAANTDSVGIVRKTQNGAAWTTVDTTEAFYPLSGIYTADDGTMDNATVPADSWLMLENGDVSGPTDNDWMFVIIHFSGGVQQ
jgi:hypothetical protein